ncbi:hypothetical protein H0H87_010448, partial [Tephrocybe sp. NHM501043]
MLPAPTPGLQIRLLDAQIEILDVQPHSYSTEPAACHDGLVKSKRERAEVQEKFDIERAAECNAKREPQMKKIK